MPPNDSGVAGWTLEAFHISVPGTLEMPGNGRIRHRPRLRTLAMPLPRRRTVLGAMLLGGVSAVAGCTASGRHTATVRAASTRYRYGNHPSQWAELYRPSGPPADPAGGPPKGTAGAPSKGTVAVIHGGFWRAEYSADLGAPLCQDLATRGWTAWNIEYRRVGDGGGWPATLDDVGAAIDLLGTLEVELSRLVALGHSAGGQLAAWAAHRSQPKVRLTGVISQAGVLDLTAAAQQQVGGSAVADLLGGTPAQVPERYLAASPQSQLPLAVPVRCVHALADANVPYAQSENYVRAATARGADAKLLTVPGDHFTLIDPSTPAWQAALTALGQLTG